MLPPWAFDTSNFSDRALNCPQYVCGQGGTAFWNGRGGKIKNNTFINIRNLDGTGVQGPSVQALYLDDQMSGWEVAENRFINCMAGSFIGGGRDNHGNCDNQSV